MYQLFLSAQTAFQLQATLFIILHITRNRKIEKLKMSKSAAVVIIYMHAAVKKIINLSRSKKKRERETNPCLVNKLLISD
jgi:hypothetical protein